MLESVSVLQEFSHIVFDPGQVLRALVHDCNHGCRAHMVTKEVRNNLRGSVIGK